MKITFSEFISIFNKLSKFFFSELSGTSRLLRSYVSTFNDYEFDNLKNIVSVDIKKEDVKEKFVYAISDSRIYIKIFTIDHTLGDKKCYYLVEPAIFKDDYEVLNLYVSKEYISSSKDITILGEIYNAIFIDLLELLYYDSDTILSCVIKRLASIFTNLIIDIPGVEISEMDKEIVNELLKYTKENYNYINLIESNELKEYMHNSFMKIVYDLKVY